MSKKTKSSTQKKLEHQLRVIKRVSKDEKLKNKELRKLGRIEKSSKLESNDDLN